MSLVLQSSGGGQITIQEPTTASNFTQTLPAADGVTMVSGNMPAFSAYANASQSITSSTFTKVAINTEVFDTNSYYDATTNYRFQPLIAGYYQVNGLVRCAGASPSQLFSSVYKNGSSYARGFELVGSGLTISTLSCSFSEIIFMNGTTDYLELYGFVTATTPTFNFSNSTATSRFSACLVRAA
jgi:hypothetical protein